MFDCCRNSRQTKSSILICATLKERTWTFTPAKNRFNCRNRFQQLIIQSKNFKSETIIKHRWQHRCTPTAKSLCLRLDPSWSHDSCVRLWPKLIIKVLRRSIRRRIICKFTSNRDSDWFKARLCFYSNLIGI